MKKTFIAAALVGTMLLTGCSGVSQEEYNSLLSENESLKSEKSQIENENSSPKSFQEENSSPKSDNSSLTAENSKSEETSNSEFHNDIFKYDDFTAGNVDVYVNSATGNKWYHDDEDTFVSYIEENDYKNKTDEELIINAYNDMVYGASQYSTHFFNIFCISDQQGNCISKGLLVINEKDDKTQMGTWLIWGGEYSRLNTNPKHLELFEGSDSLFNTSQSESQTPPTQNTATMGEKNALKKAQSYLSHSSFSRDGLIGQLEFEGFSNSEAIYGADNVGADWNEQALKKAKSYLSHSSFSYSGLIKQLEFEKFTHEQAVYGADKCGADWNEQAAKKAKSYLSHSSFSKDGLIRQLEFEGFTHEQAVYGAVQNGY